MDSATLLFKNIRPLSKQNSCDRKKGGRVTKDSFVNVRDLIQWEAKKQLMKSGWKMVTDESITINYQIFWPFPPADFENATTWYTDALNGIAYLDDSLIDHCSGITLTISDVKHVVITLTRKPLSEFSRLNLKRRGKALLK